MKHDYKDIIERAGKPDWWDENGTPRYGEFHPNKSPNIYAHEVALLQIECQNCGTQFRVEMNGGFFDDQRLAAMIKENRLRYGDPPNAGCCMAGPTMNSIGLRVLEFWRRNTETDWEWKREPSLELLIDD